MLFDFTETFIFNEALFIHSLPFYLQGGNNVECLTNQVMVQIWKMGQKGLKLGGNVNVP